MADLEAVHTLARGVLDCVCQTLNETAAQLDDPRLGCPCRACVVPGSATADNCCDNCGESTGGTLNVSVDRLYPTDPFPEPLRASRWQECFPAGLDIAVDLTVTLFRCTPTIDSQGRPPTCEQLEEAARIHHVDGWAMFRGVLCCLDSTPTRRQRGPRFVMQPLQAIAPGSSGTGGGLGGGCQGWTQKVTVALDEPCRCIPLESPS